MGCKHSLEVIASTEAFGNVYRVIRWCGKCGAIVIDGESDGRLKPGHYMKMRVPQSAAINGDSHA